MLKICLKILDLNHKHTEDPVADVAARSDAAYISRIISAMVQLTHRPLAQLVKSVLKQKVQTTANQLLDLIFRFIHF